MGKNRIVTEPETHFWRRLADSGLCSPQDCHDLEQTFRQSQTEASPTSWLVGRRVLTTYQAQLLDSEASRPFFYGDYEVLAPMGAGRLAGLLYARHRLTRAAVMLSLGPITDAGNEQLAAQRYRKVWHPNLLRVYEVLAVDNQWCAAVEPVDVRGTTLVDLAPTLGSAPAEVCHMVWQVALAL